MTGIIEVNGICKSYGRKKVLQNVGFYAAKGECVGIVGANGCGKSTLLNILSGGLKADGGTINYFGENPFEKKSVFSKLVGFVPQDNPLMEQLTVKDNLRFWYCDTNRKLNQDLENGIPAQFGLSEYENTRVSKLSGGMKKRLSIACAIAKEPRVLIMDEPGASLDIICKNDIIAYLKNFMSGGGTVILTSHEEMELKLCNRMYMLKEGQMYQFSSCPDINDIMKYIL